MDHDNSKRVSTDRTPGSDPQLDAVSKLIGQPLRDVIQHFVRVIPRAKVGGDDQLILKFVRSFQKVIKMQMPKLVDLIAAMFRPNET